MGLLRFRFCPDAVPLGWEECARQAYFSDFCGRVYETTVELQEGELICRRTCSESAKLNVVWPVEGWGCPVLTTSTLSEREEPYGLALELARGEICKLREYLAAWPTWGLSVPSDLETARRRAQATFVKALTVRDQRESERLAGDALRCALSAAESAVAYHASHRLAAYRNQVSSSPSLLGVRLQDARPRPEWSETVAACSHVVGVSCFWPQVEPVEGEYRWSLFDEQLDWCERHGLIAVGGPLLVFSESGVPEWLKRWSRDIVNLESFLADYVETTITRYIGRIRIWEIASRLNASGPLGLSDEDRVALAARILRVAQQADEEAQLYVGLVQPWGEYVAKGKQRFGPLDFADALLRFGLGITGISLEINFGYRYLGTLPRSLLDFSNLIDRWSCLEVPLLITLTFPGCPHSQPVHIQPKVWPCSLGKGWTEEAQAEWLDQVVAMLMAKPSVVGVLWNQLTDPPDTHPYPASGLLRPDGTPKPAVDCLSKHRRQWQ